MARLTRAAAIAAGTIASLAAALAGAAALGGVVSGLVERRRNRVLQPRPYRASPRAVELHRSLTVVDLHADSLLWGRDLRRRASYGHLDVPRLIEGGVAIVGMAASTKVPRRANLERNDDRTDDVTLLALAQRWPRATWGSTLARALHLALRLRTMAADSAGALTLIETRADLEAFLARRATDREITAAFLAIEGAQVLEGDLANLDILAAAGYRMLSPAHFFDTAYGGSAHGVVKGGLTAAGRDLLSGMEATGSDHGRRPRLVGDDRRCPVIGRSTGRRVAHRCPRGRPGHPQPAR